MTILSEAVEQGPNGLADALVVIHGTIGVVELARSTGGGVPTFAITVGDQYLSPELFAERGSALTAAVVNYHERYPLRPGLPKSEAASRLQIDASLVLALVEATPDLVEEGPTILRTGFTNELGPDELTAWDAARATLATDLAVPRASELGLSTEVRHVLIRRGDLVRVDDDLVLLPDQIDQITAGIHELPDAFTVAVFRDHFGLSRRHAVPLLEWLDGVGWTRRRGDGRSVSSPRAGSAGGAPTP